MSNHGQEGKKKTTANQLRKVADIIRSQAICCHEALQGYWDYAGNREGFEAMMSDCERALELLGEPMPGYAGRDAEEEEDD